MAGAHEDQEGFFVEQSESVDHIAVTFESLGLSNNATGIGRNYYSGPSYHYQQPQSANKSSNNAIMPTDPDDDFYNMSHKSRGLALIFNHEHFDDQKLESRLGTNVDCKNLARCLKELEFDVKIYKDFTYSELKYHIKWAAQLDHSQSDCILITILSHGGFEHIYAKDKPYELSSISSYFTAYNCRTLAGKPKVFFIQACRGVRIERGITMERALSQKDGATSTRYSIPNHADFLFAYSTIPGFCSWRDPNRGSWFIQSLCAELNKNGKRLDICSLLTRVSNRVALKDDQQKQMPSIVSSLTHILHFYPPSN